VTSTTEDSDVQTQIIECVDVTFQKLGQSVSQVIYFHLEKNFGIKKENIPNQPEALSKALHAIFGKGAKVIEQLILQKNLTPRERTLSPLSFSLVGAFRLR